MCTGLPSACTCPKRKRRVYPRVYGATKIAKCPISQIRGLSPCVRGYPSTTRPSSGGFRSIPVCTGLPATRSDRPLGPRVYPRVYGATAAFFAGRGQTRGLSPCVRGYRPQHGHRGRNGGSIPVCTGLPASGTGRRPRGKGLSPCVRGYRPLVHGPVFVPGSIPVCTGLPLVSGDRHGRDRVYPRVYGATRKPHSLILHHRGLSPCVRGYQSLKTDLPMIAGSIPVCTGLPLLQSVTVPAWKEHFLSFYPFSASLCRRKGWTAARYVLAHRYLK